MHREKASDSGPEHTHNEKCKTKSASTQHSCGKWKRDFQKWKRDFQVVSSRTRDRDRDRDRGIELLVTVCPLRRNQSKAGLALPLTLPRVRHSLVSLQVLLHLLRRLLPQRLALVLRTAPSLDKDP